jgi:acyl-CoA thioesterase FadM
MPKELVEFPDKTRFSTKITIRRIDLALDLHVSFATILDLVFEAHLRFFDFLGYSVTDIHGRSIIFADLVIQYQGELFYKDEVTISVAVDNMQEKYLDLFFKLTKNDNIPVAKVKIRVLFFNYEERKVVEIPHGFREKFLDIKTISPIKNDFEFNGDEKWKTLPIRKLIQECVEKVYKYAESLPASETENISLKLRSASVNILVSLSHSYHNKIYSEKIKWLVRLTSDLNELGELMEISNRLGLGSKGLPLDIFNELQKQVSALKTKLLSGKKIILKQEKE